MNFPLEDLIKTDAPEEWCHNLAYLTESLIIAAHLAAENDNSGLFTDTTRQHAVANTLEVARALISIVIDGAEGLQRKAGAGLCEKGDAA